MKVFAKGGGAAWVRSMHLHAPTQLLGLTYSSMHNCLVHCLLLLLLLLLPCAAAGMMRTVAAHHLAMMMRHSTAVAEVVAASRTMAMQLMTQMVAIER
jgi:hypothetical protein